APQNPRKYKDKTKEQRLLDKLGSDAQAGTWLDDKFEIISCLGKGGMGLVYRVKSPEHEQELALKLAFPQMNESKEDEVTKRFEREILVTQSIKHENVARVFDSGILQCGLRYMAMEIVPGEDLKSQIVREGAIAPSDAILLCKEILLALQACHEKEIVHRDLKPENIRIYKDGDRTRIRLMDFGLSRLLNEAEIVKQEIYLTQQTTVSGSPAYMAPESITDPGDVDVRCDLYSVGVCLFEFVTGTLPFTGRSIHEFLDHHLYSAVPRLEDRCPDLRFPNSLESFIRKLMEKERDLRIQSCHDALEFLSRVQEELKNPSLSKGQEGTQSGVPKGVVKKITRFFGKK
ncbi:MAG: serine/threonine-protein kinase, partial [Planctomycetota bacterium]|nr:serine/threonine-protein kinase [Planctomycetota bacterium]